MKTTEPTPGSHRMTPFSKQAGNHSARASWKEDLASAVSAFEGIMTLLPFYDGTAEYDRLAGILRTCFQRIMQILASTEPHEVEVPGSANEVIAATSIVDQALKPFQGKIKDHSILVTRTVNQRVPWFGDPSVIIEILKHLVSNAVVFSDPVKSEKWIHIDVQVSKKKVIVEVSDNGMGIDIQHQSRVFDAFYRGTERSKGLGLGLYTASQLAELLGTSIQLDSTVGQGTAMKITFSNLPHQ